eukprot:m.520856 g.520856  ORF g.520856 m.520856 type:complete len:87 (+) comp57497_c0_seq36:734-994(+)
MDIALQVSEQDASIETSRQLQDDEDMEFQLALALSQSELEAERMQQRAEEEDMIRRLGLDQPDLSATELAGRLGPVCSPFTVSLHS